MRPEGGWRAIADGEESALRALRNDARRVAARFPAEPWRDSLATLATALDTPTRTGTDQG